MPQDHKNYFFVQDFEKQFFEMFNAIFQFSQGSLKTFYRGHRQSDWSLLPSIGRPENKKVLDYSEAYIFKEYKSRGHLKLGKLSNWEILFSMQHHGLPTRLLDWTDSLNVALFFSTKNFDSPIRAETKNPCLWVLNSQNFSQEHRGHPELVIPNDDDDFSYDSFLGEPGKDTFPANYIALYPPKSNERLLAQGGMFTFHKKMDPLEANSRDFLFKVEIDKKQVNKINKYLHFTGMRENYLFPDLDGLAGQILHEARNSRPTPVSQSE